VEPVPDGCLHAPTSSSAFAHGMPAFPAARAARDTLTVYPDCHGQASTWTLLAGTGHGWRLHPALSRSLPIPDLGERFAAGRGGGRARPRWRTGYWPLNRAGIQEIPETS